VEPEQITINIGPGAKVPVPPAGHRWAEVRHDDKVTWLATWNENINGATKYVFLAAGSSLKGQSDLAKYEKARKLKVLPFLVPLHPVFSVNIRTTSTRSERITHET
jgi:DNA topoisomerase I